MTIHSEIDDTLRRLGSVEPPTGFERRVHLRLQRQPSRFSAPVNRAIAVGALAASVALSAVALNPALRSMVFHHHAAIQSAPAGNSPRVTLPVPGGFGAASAVHVPIEPVPVQPTPVNQGRGRSRSGRALLPNSSSAPLPRGVAAPHASPTTAPDSTH